MLHKQILCPFCFHRSGLTQILRRAIGGRVERDQRIAEVYGIPAPELGRVLTGAPAGVLSVPICPNCHIELPHSIATGQLGGDIIAVVGVRGAGKSNFFGVLLKELEMRYTLEVGMTLHDLLTFSVREGRSVGSRQVYRERYGNRLYNETHGATAIDPNRSAQQDVDLRFPLLYRLNTQRPWLPGLPPPFTTRSAVDLALVDCAGEDLADPVNLNLFCSFLLAARGIVFLIDVGQLPGVRDLMPAPLRARLPQIEVEPLDVISRCIELFASRGNVGVRQQIPVPVAFTLSKCDLLRHLGGAVDAKSPLFHDSRHPGGYNVADGQQADAEVRNLMRQWGAEHIVRLVEEKFTTRQFFGISALGELPDEQLHVRNLRPTRIADPLLWLMYQTGQIPAARQRDMQQRAAIRVCATGGSK